MVQEFADTHTDVPSNSTKDYRQYVPTAMVGNRRDATIRMPQPHMGTALPHRPKSKCYQTGNDLSRLEDWDGRHPASAHNKRLGSDAIEH